jgi:small subunit ribosomal protein S17
MKMSSAKRRKLDIGLLAKPPTGSCNDQHCPWHGHLKIRGRVFQGKVLSDKAAATAIVGWDYTHYNFKYERYERRRTRVAAHNPACIAAKVGDVVRVAECRPLSKTKTFVIIEKVMI